MELVAVHRLPDGDLETIPTYHCIPCHPTADREATGRLGGRQMWDARGGHPAHVRRVSHRRPQVVVGRTPGTDISYPGALGGAAEGGAMDNREGDGWCPTAV